MRRFLTVAAAAWLAVALSACGSSSAEEQLGPLEWTAQSSASSSIVKGYTDLPNLVCVLHEDQENGTARYEYLIVKGRFVTVDQGSGFRWDIHEDGNGATRVELDSRAADAEIRTYTLTFEVDEQIAPHREKQTVDSERSKTIQVGVSVSPLIGPELMEKDFLSLPDVVLFLNTTSMYDPGVWGIMSSGALLGVVQPDGSLTFPAAESPESVTGGTPATLESLVAAAKPG